jgi:tyrosinase
MRTRRNFKSPDFDQQAFVDTVLKLKELGIYDNFVVQHRDALLGAEPAHHGPGFLPWHREFLLRFEDTLQEINQKVTLPYWDWTVDNSPSPPLWDKDFMGGNGDSTQDDKVTTGKFAEVNKEWEIRVFDKNSEPPDPQGPYPFLRRALGRPDQLPTPTLVNDVMKLVPYDPPPRNGTSFRQALEDDVHSLVHQWVGPSMLSICSPNDPVFWLHHCNVDRLWARWQSLNPGWPYPPSGPNVPTGHGLDDEMMAVWTSFKPTPHCVLNHRLLGYQCDDEEAAQNYAAVSWGSSWNLYRVYNGNIEQQR